MAGEKDREDGAARLASAVADEVGLAIPADCRDAVMQHYQVLASHAARVMAATLGDEDEPAPVFLP